MTIKLVRASRAKGNQSITQGNQPMRPPFADARVVPWAERPPYPTPVGSPAPDDLRAARSVAGQALLRHPSSERGDHLSGVARQRCRRRWNTPDRERYPVPA
jgi:hypothetical protein